MFNNLFESLAIKGTIDKNRLGRAITCGNCGTTINVDDSEYTCRCGRTLCDDCGERWGCCEDHMPICNHPEIYPTQWNQPRPEPRKVIGCCKHNYICPLCGWGHGSYPHNHDKEE